jgi:hypothetical protein
MDNDPGAPLTITPWVGDAVGESVGEPVGEAVGEPVGEGDRAVVPGDGDCVPETLDSVSSTLPCNSKVGVTSGVSSSVGVSVTTGCSSWPWHAEAISNMETAAANLNLLMPTPLAGTSLFVIP